MVRTKEWKLIWFMDERVADKDGALYNLKSDPGEKVNLYGRPEYADVVGVSRTALPRVGPGNVADDVHGNLESSEVTDHAEQKTNLVCVRYRRSCARRWGCRR